MVKFEIRPYIVGQFLLKGIHAKLMHTKQVDVEVEVQTLVTITVLHT